MSVDRTKVLEAAQKHLAKGAFDKAIAEFQKLVKADPKDVRTWLKIGDLQDKIGQKKEAIETYSRVADQYAQQGFFLKAVAVFKQILKLDPQRLDIQLRLAENYEQLQLVSDALQTYEMVAATYARSGDMERALATLARMVELDENNIPTRIKYAEALSRAGKTAEAATAFEAGARLLKQSGRIDDYLKVAERLLYHRPEDVALSRELAQMYLDRSDGKRALAKLQVCFKADPKDVQTLEMLASAFEQLGQLPKTISVYREVARIHGEAHRPEERALTLKRILTLDPGDAEARQALAAYAAPAPAPARRDLAPPPGAVIEPSKPAQRAPSRADLEDLEDAPSEDDDAEILESEELSEEEARALEEESAAHERPMDDDEAYATAGDDDVIIVDDEASEPAPEPPKASEAPRPSLPPEVAREAQIAKLLTECEVFLRYGLKQKVVEQLRRVLQIDPRHVEARERLKDVLAERGETTAAAAELVTLADQFAVEKPPVAILYLRQALELDPGNPDAKARLDQLAPEPVKAPSAPKLVPPPGAMRPPTALATPAPAASAPAAVSKPFPAPGRLVPPPSARLVPPPPAAPPPPAGDDDIFFVDDEAPRRSAIPPAAPSLDDADSAFADEDERTVFGHAPDGIQDEVDRTESGLESEEPPTGLVPRAGAPAADPLAPMSPEEFESAPLRPSAPQPVAVAERMSRPSIAPGEVEELLDEAEFFVAQGLYEEARQLLSDALSAHPRHPVIRDKLAEITEAANAAAAAAAAAASDQSFELAERLADELGPAQGAPAGSDVLDVEQVFAQFKKGVEQQVGLEDTDTHFDLGIAYKEMGLLGDAIGEFSLCLANPQRVCIAETMIGLCHIEKGEVAEGIIHYKKGLYADHKTDREELGLYYELGRAYEMLGDPKEALYYYEKVKKRDGTFRNVDDRIEALAHPAPAQSVVAANPADDIDAVFDDLMGKE
ncbi:MAG: tetratricopeptide repeat protein [Sandaracinus sp.]